MSRIYFKNLSALPAEFDSASGKDRQEREQKEKEGETSNDREYRTQLNIYAFKCQHLFGTIFALIFCSDAEYALFWWYL